MRPGPGTGLRHAVLVLAAGSSRRLGFAKQGVLVSGEPLLRRTVRLAAGCGPSEILVSVRDGTDPLLAVLSGLGYRAVSVPDASEGMAASLRRGLAALSPGVDGLLVLLCDHVRLEARHLDALVGRWRDAPERAVASAYAGTIGVPAMFPSSWWPRLAQLTGDEGARSLLRARSETVTCIEAEALSQDLDGLQDLNQARAVE